MQHPTDYLSPEQVTIKPRLADIIKAMEPGDRVRFEAEKYGALNTARCAASRENAKLGRQEYFVSSKNNGVTYVIERVASVSNNPK